MLEVTMEVLLKTYDLAKDTFRKIEDNTDTEWYRKPLYAYLMAQDEMSIEVIRTIMYVGRAIYSGERFKNSKENIYNVYNICAKGPQNISAMEICRKDKLHEYLECGYEYFELPVLNS